MSLTAFTALTSSLLFFCFLQTHPGKAVPSMFSKTYNRLFLTKRADAIRARKSLVKTIRSGDLNYKTLREIVEYDGKLKYHNIEQLAARLLYDLTRNTGISSFFLYIVINPIPPVRPVSAHYEEKSHKKYSAFYLTAVIFQCPSRKYHVPVYFA